jgi:hypothetical protein
MIEVKDQTLWAKIEAYKLDAVDASFPFSARLMRENGWTEEYTLEVIQEYKKFMFLVAVSGHPVSPSDPVDQVWHLHMIYTRSYWDEFCHGILGMPVHHNPTKGGREERKKHVNMYDRTAESYLKYFGEPQPSHIWINTKDLFKEIHYRRVNMHRNWVIPKPQFVRKRWHLIPLLALLASLTMASVGGIILIVVLVIIVIGLMAAAGGTDEVSVYSNKSDTENNTQSNTNSQNSSAKTKTSNYKPAKKYKAKPQSSSRTNRDSSSSSSTSFGGWLFGCGSDSSSSDSSSSDSGSSGCSSDSGSSGCSSCSSCSSCGGCGGCG